MKGGGLSGIAADCSVPLLLLAALWLVVLAGLYLFGTHLAQLGCSVAWGIVSVAVLAGAVLRYSLRATPVQAVLAGGTLRMLVAAAAAVCVMRWDQRLGLSEFVVWLIVMYLVSLAADLWWQVRLQSQG